MRESRRREQPRAYPISLASGKPYLVRLSLFGFGLSELGRNKRTVWDISLGKFRDAHFAVFPEELVKNCILASTREQDIVLDPFMGSGTTACVARKNGRSYLGIELVPKYIKIAEKRLDEIVFQPALLS